MADPEFKAAVSSIVAIVVIVLIVSMAQGTMSVSSIVPSFSASSEELTGNTIRSVSEKRIQERDAHETLLLQNRCSTYNARAEMYGAVAAKQCRFEKHKRTCLYNTNRQEKFAKEHKSCLERVAKIVADKAAE